MTESGSKHELTWLHISDFHFRSADPYDRDVVLESLVDSVGRFHDAGRTVDLVFATGDIAHSGHPAEYELATSFFDALLEKLRLPRDRLFVVPGNHDVDRKIGRKLLRTLNNQEESNEYFDPQYSSPHATEKMRAYGKWFDTYFQGIRNFPTNSSCGAVEVVSIKGHRLAILPINSALFSLSDDDHAKLWIGRRCLDASLPKLRDATASVKIVMLHHPIDWLSDVERSSVMAALHKDVDVILRGHLHETGMETVVTTNGQALYMAAGAAYQTMLVRPKRAYYSTLSAERKLKVFPIRYEDAPVATWTTDPSVFPHEEAHVGSFTLGGSELPTAGTLQPASSHGVHQSYLRWIVSCHERLEFRGIHHANGGAVSVPLQQVYLALQADGTSRLERAAAHAALLAEIKQSIESGDIDAESAAFASWYAVAGNPNMPSLEMRDRLNTLSPGQKELLNLGEAYFRESQLVILGDPGSGKTTLTRWLALITAKALLAGKTNLIAPLYQVDPSVDDVDEPFSLGRARLPLLIRVAEYAKERQLCAEAGRVAPTLVEFLGRQTWLGSAPVWDEASPQCGQKIDASQLNQLFLHELRAGNALIILDGLDEVPDSSLREEIVEEVDAFAQQWVRRRSAVSQTELAGDALVPALLSVTADSPGNRLIVTSRIAGYQVSPLRGNLAHVTIEPMSLRAIRRFITNWMGAIHEEIAAPGVAHEHTLELAKREADQFMSALLLPRQRGGRELAANPLLCGILATIFRQRIGSLPQERVDLYKQAVELFFDIWLRRQRESDQSRLMMYELYAVLEPIAEHVHRHEPTGLIPENELKQLTLQFLADSRGENPLRATPKLKRDVDEMIRIIREDVGLLAARGEGVYGFLHLTFQEYLAARSLVKDPPSASQRLDEHLGDFRWREVVRLALGHLNSESDADFHHVVKVFITQRSKLDDLLPQAALAVVGAIPDLHRLSPELIERLSERLLQAYANRDLLMHLPRRREMLEQAFSRLLEADSESAVENYIVRTLQAIGSNAEFGLAAAHLLVRLDYFTPELFRALSKAGTYDSSSWKWPLHQALRIAVTAKPDSIEPRVVVPIDCLPFRQALLSEPKLVANIRADIDWLMIVLALYGGVGDYQCADRIAEYHSIGGFLQQESDYRERYRLAFLDRWGAADGDFAYNMAVYLDTAGGAKYGQAKAAQGSFDPQRIHRDSQWTAELLGLLRKGESPRHLLPQLVRASADASNSRWVLEARFLLTLLDPQVKDNNWCAEEISRVQFDLADAVTRCGPKLDEMLSALLPSLEPATWGALYEATRTLTMEHGCEPMLAMMEYGKLAPAQLKPHLLADALILSGQAWGDDADYNSAVFADAIKLAPGDFLAAHSVLPLAVNRRLKFRHHTWPIASLPPLEGVRGELHDLSPHLLTTIEMLPANLGFMRVWAIGGILKPVIQANPNLLPEILACALGDCSKRGGRSDLFEAFAKGLLGDFDPAQEIDNRLKGIEDPYYRARGLLRLASHWPERRKALISEAADVAKLENNPLHRQYLYEWLHLVADPEDASDHFTRAFEASMDIIDPDNRARALGRLGIATHAERSQHCFQLAFEAASHIQDEFDRGTTVRLLRRSTLDRSAAAYELALHSFKNPIQQARAEEDWQAVIHLSSRGLREESAHRELWSIIILAAGVQSKPAFHDSETQFWQEFSCAPAPSRQLLLREATRVSLLELTPIACRAIEEFAESERLQLAEALLPRMRPASWDVIPFLNRLRFSRSPTVSSLACLFLTELMGLANHSIQGLVECLVAPDDLTRNRAATQLFGSSNDEPNFRTSLIGRETLDLLFDAGADPVALRRNRIGHSVAWFCERLLYDSTSQIAAWAERLRNEPDNVSIKRALAMIHFVEERSWRQLLVELERGPLVVREAIFLSMARLAYKGRLPSWDELCQSVSRCVDRANLNSGGVYPDAESMAAALFQCATPDFPLDPAETIARVRQSLSSSKGFQWSGIFSEKQPEVGFNALSRVGQSLYVVKSIEVDRWAYNGSIAKSGMEQPGFLELLTMLTQYALQESVRDLRDFDFERDALIELLAGVATIAPARFHSLPSKETLRSLLIQAAINQRFYPARSDAVRLLGYMRHLSEDCLPALRSALTDVLYVQDGAMEAMGMFRRMDSSVLPEIRGWLNDASGLTAFASARLLTAIGRHTQVSGRNDRTAIALRRDIINALAEATQDSRSHRPLDFGTLSSPTPEIPMLSDFFFDCMLRVAGYDEPVKADASAKSKKD